MQVYMQLHSVVSIIRSAWKAGYNILRGRLWGAFEDQRASARLAGSVQNNFICDDYVENMFTVFYEGLRADPNWIHSAGSDYRFIHHILNEWVDFFCMLFSSVWRSWGIELLYIQNLCLSRGHDTELWNYTTSHPLTGSSCCRARTRTAMIYFICLLYG